MARLTDENGNELRFERETCSRCGGTGHYSYCQMYGTTCFKCAGRKEVLSKRGELASAYLSQLRSIRMDEVKVGDIVKMMAITMGGTPYDAWVKVEKVENDVQEGASLKDGVMVPYRMDVIVLSGSRKGMEHGKQAACDSMVEKVYSRDVQIEMLKKAIAYQNSLTKAGKRRVRA